MSLNPYLITLKKNAGKSGNLSFLEENNDLPIQIKRVYWIYEVSADAERGNHAHLASDRIIVCVHGVADVSIENTKGEIFSFRLATPSQAVFLPRYHWVRIKLSQGAVLITLASSLFEEDVVERDYVKFKSSALQ